MPVTDNNLYLGIKISSFANDGFDRESIPSPAYFIHALKQPYMLMMQGLGSKAAVVVIKMQEGDEIKVGDGTSIFNVDGWLVGLDIRIGNIFTFPLEICNQPSVEKLISYLREIIVFSIKTASW